MKTIVEQSGKVLKGLTRIVVDTVAEVATLGSSYGHGSECFCIENGLTYYLRGDGFWVPPLINEDMDPANAGYLDSNGIPIVTF